MPQMRTGPSIWRPWKPGKNPARGRGRPYRPSLPVGAWKARSPRRPMPFGGGTFPAKTGFLGRVSAGQARAGGEPPWRSTPSGNAVMRYLALVTDFDGTIAIDGKMAGAAVTAIERLRMSGRRAILVTGRR